VVEPGGSEDGDDDGVEKDEEVRRLEAEEEEVPEEREVGGGDGKRHFDSHGRKHESEPEKEKFPSAHDLKEWDDESDEKEVCRSGNNL